MIRKEGQLQQRISQKKMNDENNENNNDVMHEYVQENLKRFSENNKYKSKMRYE